MAEERRFCEYGQILSRNVVDRPGHGLSGRPRLSGTPREQADQIAAGLNEMGVRRAKLVAHSFGALVALAVAERHPAMVDELVLVAPLAFPEPRLIEHSLLAPRSIPFFGPLFAQFAEFTQLDRPMVQLLHHVMFAPAPVPAVWKVTYPYGTILSATSIVAEAEDSASMLPLSPAGTLNMRGIKVPTQVLTGTSDRVVEDERQAKTLARQLPFGSLIEVEGADTGSKQPPNGESGTCRGWPSYESLASAIHSDGQRRSEQSAGKYQVNNK